MEKREVIERVKRTLETEANCKVESRTVYQVEADGEVVGTLHADFSDHCEVKGWLMFAAEVESADFFDGYDFERKALVGRLEWTDECGDHFVELEVVR